VSRIVEGIKNKIKTLLRELEKRERKEKLNKPNKLNKPKKERKRLHCGRLTKSGKNAGISEEEKIKNN